MEDDREDGLPVGHDESLRERGAPGDEVEERARGHLDRGDGALDEAGPLEAADRSLSRFGTPLGHAEVVRHGPDSNNWSPGPVRGQALDDVRAPEGAESSSGSP
jgi:hypothetical protein